MQRLDVEVLKEQGQELNGVVGQDNGEDAKALVPAEGGGGGEKEGVGLSSSRTDRQPADPSEPKSAVQPTRDSTHPSPLCPPQQFNFQ